MIQPRLSSYRNCRLVRPAGFTLIELLVVVAIISLLVSILLPSLGRAKIVAKRVVCQTQLKQVGAAFYMYAEDYDGYFPQPRFEADGSNLQGYQTTIVFGRAGLVKALAPYLGNPDLDSGDVVEAMICPTDEWAVGVYGHHVPPHELALSYQYHEIIRFDRFSDPHPTLDDAKRPSEAFILWDKNPGAMGMPDSGHGPAPESGDTKASANFLFVDSHVEFHHHSASYWGDWLQGW